ncbi:MAG: arginine--tRNA ligase [Candidatus Pacebacteria bacterium]|nr:arginine--tRNA ligase [Candidatus Paceibacterota bacterium]
MMNIRERVEKLFKDAIVAAGFEKVALKDSSSKDSGDIVVEVTYPVNIELADLSFSTSMKIANVYKENSIEIAKKILSKIKEDEYIEKIEIAGMGFINIFLSEKFFKENLREILENNDYGKNKDLDKEKMIVEYTDLNPFKKFHIGHLMSNAVGEAMARIFEYNGAEVKRADYQGDTGLHVAKAVWAVLKGKGRAEDGTGYAAGAKAYEEDEEAKKEINDVNKKIYSKEDERINEIYKKGREDSLEMFEKIYKKLGTKFDFYFFESETWMIGKEIVEENKQKVFEESEGAIVFRGEKRNKALHTRVFINKEGLPTYEAKELGLAKLKSEKYSFSKSVVVTGNEVDAYFKVVLEAMKEIMPELAEKIVHISHGMLRLPTGKMSSRTGEAIAAEDLIEKVKEEIYLKVAEKDGFNLDNWKKIGDKVAVGAIKYSILKQSPGRDIIFDFEKSISFEGDSGPYLMYTYARIKSLLEQAEKGGIKGEISEDFEMNQIIRVLSRFSEVIKEAKENLTPNYIATYLYELASAFNAFYAGNKIANSKGRVALAESVGRVLKNGLYVLGIEVVEKM